MKRYELLKDLPFAKAGETFREMFDDETTVLAPEEWGQHRQELHINEIKNFDEWFEEIKEPEFFYYIDEKGLITKVRTDYRHADIHLRKAIGNYFETEEDAEKHLEWLKARAVLVKDTKGFKPDWYDFHQTKWWVEYYYEDFQFMTYYSEFRKAGNIYFATKEDAQNSIKTHEKEWKIYYGLDD